MFIILSNVHVHFASALLITLLVLFLAQHSKCVNSNTKYHRSYPYAPRQILQIRRQKPRKETNGSIPKYSKNTYEISHFHILVYLALSLLKPTSPNSPHDIAPVREVSSCYQNITFHLGNSYRLRGLGLVIQ